MKIFKNICIAALWLAVCITGWIPEASIAGTIATSILQKQFDRIYLPHGEEALIMPGARFTIACGGDTSAHGTIEWSRPGIAVSHPIAGLSDMSDCMAETVWVEIPDVDSSSNIRIMLDEEVLWFNAIDPVPGNSDPLENTGSLGRTGAGNKVFRVKTSYVGSIPPVDATIDFASEDTSGNARARQWVVEAPFIAAIVPNLSKPCNAQGFLTTSAYYRFGDIHLPYLLGGAATKRHDRFDRQDSASSRLYPFAPERGRGLLGGIDDLPKSIRISYHDGLEEAADFFADVLSRDRISVEVTDNDSTADLFLVWLPFRTSDPVVGPWTLLNMIRHDEPTTEMQREALALIDQYLLLAEGSRSEDARDYYLNLVDRSFKEDLGVFPLFRPSLVYTASSSLRNLRTDLDGRLQIEDLILLTTPPATNAGGAE